MRDAYTVSTCGGTEEQDDRDADLMRTHWFLGLEPQSPSMSWYRRSATAKI